MSSSSSDQLPRKRIKLRRGVQDFCSTPTGNRRRRLSSLPISAVDTCSSSSVERDLQKKKSSKFQRNKQLKVLGDSNRNIGTRWKHIPQCTTIRKKSSKTKENGYESRVSNGRNRSPERIRDARIFEESRLDSPLSGPQAVLHISNEDFHEDGILPLKDVPNLSLRGVDNDKEDYEEDLPLFIRKEDVHKTYQPPVTKVKHAFLCYDNSKEEKPKNLLTEDNNRLPTASSDLLWDDFVKKNCKNIGRYLARPTIQSTQPNLQSSIATSFATNQNGQLFKKEDIRKKDARERAVKGKQKGRKGKKKRRLIKPEHTEMASVRGYRDNRTKNWVIIDNVFDYVDAEDIEFEYGGENGGRMSFNTFHRAQKLQNERSENLSTIVDMENSMEIETHSKTSENSSFKKSHCVSVKEAKFRCAQQMQNIRKRKLSTIVDVKNSMEVETHSETSENDTLKQSYRVPVNESRAEDEEETLHRPSQIEREKRKIILKDVSQEELERINKMRMLAARENAIRKRMLNNQISLQACKKQRVEETSKLERNKNEHDGENFQRNTKKRKSRHEVSDSRSKCNKVKIISSQTLHTLRYKKMSNNWQSVLQKESNSMQ